MKKNESKNKVIKARKRGAVPSREILYSEAAKHAPRAIEIITEIMEHGDSDSNRLGAAKTLLAKAIPDLSSTELFGKDGQPINITVRVDLAGGYIPAVGPLVATSTIGNKRPAQV